MQPELKKTPAQRPRRRTPPVQAASPAKAQAKIVKEAKRLFQAKLADIITMPRPEAALTVQAFELTMLEMFSSHLVEVNNILPDRLEIDRKTAKPLPVQPTPRLRQAMASADKITRGRFASPAGMFRALGKNAGK